MTTLMEYGGAQKALLELARGLQDRGHKVTVLATHDTINVIPHFAKTFGIRIVNLEMKRPGTSGTFRASLLLVRGIWRMYGLMRSGHYDVLQTFQIYANVMGQFVGALAGIPVRVSSQRNRNDNYSQLVRLLDRLVANSALTHRMVAVCEANRRYCIESLGICAAKLVTIHNGISSRTGFDTEKHNVRENLRAELGIAAAHVIATVVARLHPQKGHIYLLEAIEKLGATIPDLLVLLVGDGPLRGKLSEEIRHRKLSLRVRMLGNRQDVAAILGISDLFVLPSLWEGLPNAVLEAMVAGLPVIAADVDGTGEMVVHGLTGLLVPSGDPAALADAIADLATNAERRQMMGEAGRERVEAQFSIKRFINHFEDLYVELSAT